MKKGDCFCISISESGRKTTRYFSTLVKIASMLILVDRYLLTNFSKLKQRISHVLHNDTFSDKITIEEVTAYDGDIGTILRLFLKSGKELILSSLEDIETTTDLDTLLNKLTSLLYKAQEDLRPYNFLDVLSHSSLDKIALAKILNHIWQNFYNSGLVTTIKIESLDGSPRAIFTKKPPLREWLPKIEEITQEGKFELRHIDFADSRKWKAVLFDYLHDRPICVEIKDLSFLESLISTDENQENGILHGDIIKALYTTEHDPLTDKTTFKIIEVRDRWRRSQFTQLDLPLANDAAPPEPSSEPDVEKTSKKGKKKHKSWR
jgi:hypothetical protein